VFFNLLTQLILYTQQETRQSVGQGLEQRPVSSCYGLHRSQRHTHMPASPLWDTMDPQ